MTIELQNALDEHRHALLRHCYRMMGSIFDAEDVLFRAAHEEHPDGDGGFEALLRLVTRTCLDQLSYKRPLKLPYLETDPALEIRFGPADPARWVTPAADAELFASAAEKEAERQTSSIDFVTLLQTLSPLQRAAFLERTGLGWPHETIAEHLGLTAAGVASAVRRAGEVMAQSPRPSELPAPEVLAGLVRAWESHDLDTLCRVLHPDALLAMPPFDGWLHGSGSLRGFFGSTRFEAFWARGLRVKPTDANAGPALAFYRPGPDGVPVAQAIMVLRFEGGRVAELIAFVGRRYFHGFEIPTEMDPLFEGGAPR